MLWRNSRGRPLNASAAFIHPCQPIVAKQPPTGPGWAHELKHDGYRLQIHVRDGRVRLFTMNGADWSDRYPRIVEEAPRINGTLVMDPEGVCLIKKGVADFDMLHGRTSDHLAVACAFDLLIQDGADLRRRPFRERKSALSKLASSSSSVMSWRRESTISNSFGNRLATMRKYSTGFSTRAIFTASSPNSSKSLAIASSSAVLMRSREPFLRPPLPGWPFSNNAIGEPQCTVMSR